MCGEGFFFIFGGLGLTLVCLKLPCLRVRNCLQLFTVCDEGLWLCPGVVHLETQTWRVRRWKCFCAAGRLSHSLAKMTSFLCGRPSPLDRSISSETLLGATLVGRSWKTLFWESLLRHYCEIRFEHKLLRDTCGKLLWDTLVTAVSETILWDTTVLWETSGRLSSETLVGLLWKTGHGITLATSQNITSATHLEKSPNIAQAK